MKKIIKSMWGLIPLGLTLLCAILIMLTQRTTGDTLRILYRNLLIFFGIGSVGFLLFWGNIQFNTFRKGTDERAKSRILFRVGSYLLSILSIFIVSSLLVVGLFIVVVSYRVERVVTRNDIKMVACIDDFSDVTVVFYQYKNPFFFGKRLGFEYYGNGVDAPLSDDAEYPPLQWAFWDLDGHEIESGSNAMMGDINGDSLEYQKQMILQQEAKIKQLDITVMDNREDELVFSISIDDFIDSFNGYYWSEYESRYLLPSSMWMSFRNESSIHSKHPTDYYRFTSDDTIWSLPAISVYVPSNGSYIQEITLDFDEHSYTESMYRLYERTCFYALKVFFPYLKDEKIIELYTELNLLAGENVFPNEQGYGSGSIPCALFHKNGIGLYPYFAIGESLHLCIIPVTDETITAFEAKGVEIHEIE